MPSVGLVPGHRQLSPLREVLLIPAHLVSGSAWHKGVKIIVNALFGIGAFVSVCDVGKFQMSMVCKDGT